MLKRQLMFIQNHNFFDYLKDDWSYITIKLN